jgi:hypothetical protein
MAGPRRPEREAAGGIGEAAAGDGDAFLRQLRRGFVVGREQHLEGRAVPDLGVELAGAAEGQLRPVSALLLEFGGEKLRRRGEIGGDGDLDVAGAGGAGGEQQGNQKSSHVSGPKQGE